MKKLFFIICFVFVLSNSFALARGGPESAKQICGIVEISLYDEFVSLNKPLPKSFEDMSLLLDCAERQWIRAPKNYELLNDLVIVPGAPKIKKEIGIGEGHIGNQLFAISRTWHIDNAKSGDKSGNITNPKSAGRYAILISDNSSLVVTNWIPEVEAEIILKQVKGFDPKNQPRSFEKSLETARLNEMENVKIEESINKAIQDRHRPTVKKSVTLFLKRHEIISKLLIIFVVFISGFAVWKIIRIKRRAENN